MMRNQMTGARRAFMAALLAAACAPAWAQSESKTCAMVLMHDAGSSPVAVAGFGRKLQATCMPKVVEMPWSQRRNNDKDLPGAWVEINRHIKGLREQGFKRVLVAGYGFGANAALAYSGEAGQADGVIALAPEARAVGLGELPATATRMAQHIPALWIIGTDDPLHERGETFAYAKAPLHPASRYATVKADRKGTPDAAVKTVVEWIKSQE